MKKLYKKPMHLKEKGQWETRKVNEVNHVWIKFVKKMKIMSYNVKGL